jgi:tryptophan-rich sensory protein
MVLLGVKGFVILSFIFMITMNIIANTKPLYGHTTGEISDKYPTLFTPSGFTFSIWGIIYILLSVFTAIFIIDSTQFAQPLMVGIGFGVSSILNGVWLNFWHQDKQGFSSIVMLGILISLIYTYVLIQNDSFVVKLPMSVYLGWISVATIAQLSILLYPYRPASFKAEVTIFFIILIVGIMLASMMRIVQEDFVYALIIIWGYWGIYSKHKTINHPRIARGILGCISAIAIITIIFPLI